MQLLRPSSLQQPLSSKASLRSPSRQFRIYPGQGLDVLGAGHDCSRAAISLLPFTASFSLLTSMGTPISRVLRETPRLLFIRLIASRSGVVGVWMGGFLGVCACLCISAADGSISLSKGTSGGCEVSMALCAKAVVLSSARMQ